MEDVPNSQSPPNNHCCVFTVSLSLNLKLCRGSGFDSIASCASPSHRPFDNERPAANHDARRGRAASVATMTLSRLPSPASQLVANI
jgi:hypothetical protein